MLLFFVSNQPKSSLENFKVLIIVNGLCNGDIMGLSGRYSGIAVLKVIMTISSCHAGSYKVSIYVISHHFLLCYV